MPRVEPFRPGTNVKVLDGTFAGMSGRVLSLTEARALHQENGGQEPPLMVTPDLVGVQLDLFGHNVPVWLESWQVVAK